MFPFTSTASPPAPLRFERHRVPVWNPYSRGRLSPAKSEGEGKTDANLTIFLSTYPAGEVCREAMEARRADPWEPVYEVEPGFYVTRMSCLISARGAGYSTCALHRMRDTISHTGAPFGRKRSAPCLKAATR